MNDEGAVSSASSSVPAVLSVEPSTSGVAMETKDLEEPPQKKQRTDKPTDDKLENRLGGILCCAVCLDLPRTAIYQCANGHLMCAGCFTHLLADAKLRDETSTCPNCRVEISRTSASRNLAVEKAVNELPASCRFCSAQFPRYALDRHETELCEARPTSCKYNRVGCQWRGPTHEVLSHEDNCAHPKKSGAELMDSILALDDQRQKQLDLCERIFDLLSFEKIQTNDLQLRPYRTDEFIHKLFYETSNRFTAFGHQWAVKARINDSQRDPTQSCERTISYQLILKSKTSSPLMVHYGALRGPFGEMKLHPRVYQFEFSDDQFESPYNPLPLTDSDECNKLLASKTINCRLIMFQVTK